MTKVRASLYHRHRFPAEIIAEAVWLYYRFPLSLRMVEDMLAYRGIISSTIRLFANGPRNSVVLMPIKSVAAHHALVTNGILMRWSSRSKVNAIFCGVRWIRMALCLRSLSRNAVIPTQQSGLCVKSGQGCSARVLITDKLGSYGAAKRELRLSVCDHRQHKGLNNRAENSHQPIRRRERVMKRFKSARHLQRFTSIHDPIYNLHHFPRNLLTSSDHRELRQTATDMWREIACLKSA